MTEPVKPAPQPPRVPTLNEEIDTVLEENRIAAKKRAESRAERDRFIDH